DLLGPFPEQAHGHAVAYRPTLGFDVLGLIQQAELAGRVHWSPPCVPAGAGVSAFSYGRQSAHGCAPQQRLRASRTSSSSASTRSSAAAASRSSATRCPSS